MSSEGSRVSDQRGAEWLGAMVRIRLFEETLAELYGRELLVGVDDVRAGERSP
jgi:TPP-dependent pyruvate/acetoin dehydrogenase alpha subunit